MTNISKIAVNSVIHPITIPQSQVVGLDSALAAKQNTLTFDNTPTSGSNNPVKSSGIYTALSQKQKSVTVSTSTPSAGTGSDGDIWMVYSA